MKLLALAALLAAQSTALELNQASFDNGPVVISDSGMYTITEDISLDFRHVNAAHPLGHFAGIVVAADDVEIDLGGFRFEMSADYALAQRWFSLIELGSQPFVKGQGPAKWAEDGFTIAKNIRIHNGVTGRSSHHAFHGNDAEGITIENVTIEDFEVGGISMNKCMGCTFSDLVIGPSSTDTPALAMWSGRNFMMPTLANVALAHGDDIIPLAGRPTAFKDIISALEHTPVTDPLFANPSGLPDGSAIYGLLVHKHGVAIGAEPTEHQSATMSTSINIHNVTVKDLNLNMVEWPITDNTNVFGDHINVEYGTNHDGSYKGNVLMDAQVALNYLQREGASVLPSHTLGRQDGFLEWAMGDTATLEGPNGDPVPVQCGFDVMKHTVKGVYGVRLDFVQAINITGLTVQNIQATRNADLSTDACSTMPFTKSVSVFKSNDVDMFDVHSDFLTTGWVNSLAVDSFTVDKWQLVGVDRFNNKRDHLRTIWEYDGHDAAAALA